MADSNVTRLDPTINADKQNGIGAAQVVLFTGKPKPEEKPEDE